MLSSVLDEGPAAKAVEPAHLAAIAKRVTPPPPLEPTFKGMDRAGLDAASALVIKAVLNEDKADERVLSICADLARSKERRTEPLPDLQLPTETTNSRVMP